MATIQLPEDWVRRVNAACRKVENLRGPGIKNTPDTLSINNQQGSRLAPVPINLGAVVRRVNLTVTDGSAAHAGDKTTPVSFTYDVYSLTDSSNKLNTSALAPEWPSRSENGKRVAATNGTAYTDTSGNIQIAIAFEAADTTACS